MLEKVNISHLRITNDSVTHILDHLSPTLEQLELTDNNIDSEKLFQLKLMPKLKNFDTLEKRGFYFFILHELRQQLPHVSVNGYPPIGNGL